MAIRSGRGPMFGYYDIPFKIMDEEISLRVDREGENLLYSGAGAV